MSKKTIWGSVITGSSYKTGEPTVSITLKYNKNLIDEIRLTKQNIRRNLLEALIDELEEQLDQQNDTRLLL